MENNNVLESFFSRRYENCINKKMLMYSYNFPTDDIQQYMSEINNIPISSYLEMGKKYIDSYLITSKDVFQFSNFTVATNTICEVLKELNNPGVSFCDAGKLLLKDGIERTDTAYRKYGENHLKTAEILGLIFGLEHTYFVSCFGYIISNLDKEFQHKFILRCLLRCKLITKLFAATNNGDVYLEQFLYMLSPSTYKRRLTNLSYLLKFINSSEEYDFSSILLKIKY